MSGIYFHIPYCKKACHYCDFHFSTNLSTRDRVLNAMNIELERRKEYLQKDDPVQTIYFGGGTPSVLRKQELEFLFNTIHKNYIVDPKAEISFEVNPDDVTSENIRDWKQLGINRISIGIQSFQDEQLQAMNRSHTSDGAHKALKMLRDAGFENITADLMYGLSNDSIERLVKDLDLLLEYNIPHLSTYCLTIEEKTVYGSWYENGKLIPADDDLSVSQYNYIISTLQKKGFIHYEISNFGKPGYLSRHNSNYWKGSHYLGIGPGAHSFNGVSRQYNKEHNVFYADDIEHRKDSFTLEMLDLKTRLNEYLLTSIRTIWGVDLKRIEMEFGTYFEQFCSPIEGLVNSGLLEKKDGHIFLTSKGKHFSDRITQELFLS